MEIVAQLRLFLEQIDITVDDARGEDQWSPVRIGFLQEVAARIEELKCGD